MILDKYHCPVTFKVFNENTHIVAIRTTGNVFAFDVINYSLALHLISAIELYNHLLTLSLFYFLILLKIKMKLILLLIKLRCRNCFDSLINLILHYVQKKGTL